MGIPFGFGQRMLYDSHQQFVRSGLPVFLRVRDWLEQEADGTSSDYLEVGVPIAPSGAASVATGYSDIAISPPPNVVDVSMHNIGILAGRLNFGSQIFYVSHSFVLAQMAFLSITDPYEVWRDRDGHKTIGLFYNGRIFSIESITHRDAAGEIIAWKIIGNAPETASTST